MSGVVIDMQEARATGCRFIAAMARNIAEARSDNELEAIYRELCNAPAGADPDEVCKLDVALVHRRRDLDRAGRNEPGDAA